MDLNKEIEVLNVIGQINSVLNQIRDITYNVTESVDAANKVSTIDKQLSDCSTLWKNYCDCFKMLEKPQQDLLYGKSVQNWNGIEVPVFAYESQFQRVFSDLKECVMYCKSYTNGISDTQSFSLMRKQVEKLLGRKLIANHDRSSTHHCLIDKKVFFNAVRICLSEEKYSSFKGRASRSEYWYFVLFYYLVVLAVSLVVCILSMLCSNYDSEVQGVIIVVPSLIVGIGLFFPMISVLVRRLHDTGRSGGWVVLLFIPVINSFVSLIIFVFCCLPSMKRYNEYGPYLG